jgi:hypothetical protein
VTGLEKSKRAKEQKFKRAKEQKSRSAKVQKSSQRDQVCNLIPDISPQKLHTPAPLSGGEEPESCDSVPPVDGS